MPDRKVLKCCGVGSIQLCVQYELCQSQNFVDKAQIIGVWLAPLNEHY